MFQGPRMPYGIFLGIVLQAFQQLTGANYFFYYGTVVFNGADDPWRCQFRHDIRRSHFGRRKLLITGGMWMFVCFMAFPSVGHFSLNVRDPPQTPRAGKAMVVFACLFITGFAMTWGPTSLSFIRRDTAPNWLWNFLIGFFTPFITGDIDFAYGYVFAECLFAAVVIVYFCVLEGKGKTFEEMDMMYVMRVPAWNRSKWVPPPPEHRITTAQALDRRTAVGIDRAESSDKQDADSDGGHHQHIDDSGAGPSSA
ncbi:LOW QUALITY PROTEIN: sugar transporter [Aspergillus lentulus]|nr:LOW QUALITY PROTEIN: sugar transporter [Aspergillus lentulus]